MEQYLTLVIIFAILSSILCSAADLKLDKVFKGEVKNSNVDTYSLIVTNEMIGNDLLIKSSIISDSGYFKEPIIVISQDTVFEEQEKSVWICGELGPEHCSFPSRYLKSGDVLGISVICESCKYELELVSVKTDYLSFGKQIVFHLKKGDKKVFQLESFTNKYIGKPININLIHFKDDDYEVRVDMSNKII